MKKIFVLISVMISFVAFADYNEIYNQAVELYGQKQFAEAARLFDSLPFEYKTFPAQWYRASSHGQSGEPLKAVVILEACLPEPVQLGTNQPRNNFYYYNELARYVRVIGDADRAIAWSKISFEHFKNYGLDASLLGINWGRTLLACGKSLEAYEILQPYIAAVENTSQYLISLYALNIELLCANKSSDAAYDFMKKIEPLQLGFPGYVYVQLISLFAEAGEVALKQEKIDTQRAIKFFTEAKNLIPGENPYRGSSLDRSLLEFYVGFAEYLGSDNYAPQKAKVALRFRTFAFARLEAEADCGDGEASVSNILEDGLIEKYEGEFRLFARLLNYYSGGQISAVNQTQVLDLTVTKIDALSWSNYVSGEEGVKRFLLPDKNSAGREVAYASWLARNEADCFVWIFPMQGLPYVAVHGTPSIEYVKNRLYSPRRFQIYLHSDAAKRSVALVHEFFHAVEYTFNPPRDSGMEPLLIPHLFKPSMDAFWPSWFAGEHEIVYYFMAFREILLAQNLDLSRLMVSREVDATRREELDL
ncbi:MAG: hypothetical protein JXR63_06635 [Spirochaetales bacterium]|nr:hypothetical protein [Spirochaetales bacterium]